MFEWSRSVQKMLDCVEENLTNPLTLESLASELHYSPYYCTRQFHRYAGISLRDYIRLRKVSSSVADLRDTGARIIDIALKYGFSSQEAFTRSFKNAYGITPGEYRKCPRPLLLRTKPHVFEPERYGLMEENMEDLSADITVAVKVIPAHKVIGVVHKGVASYWDFWKRDEETFRKDRCDEIDGLLTSIGSALEIVGASIVRDNENFYVYGITMPGAYSGEIPRGMESIHVPETTCAVFYHPPYDYVKMEKDVDAAFDKVIGAWDPNKQGYEWDFSKPHGGRHNPADFGQERVKPLKKLG